MLEAQQGIGSLALPRMLLRAVSGDQPGDGPLPEPGRVPAREQNLGRRRAGREGSDGGVRAIGTRRGRGRFRPGVTGRPEEDRRLVSRARSDHRRGR